MASKSSPSRPKAGTRRPTSELAEAGGDDKLPHYYGHRERLRERFLNGGRDTLPDYELLELLLFMAIPRRNIKPLAKSLIAEFKTFAATISAPNERLKEFGLSENAIVSLKVVEAAARRLAGGAVVGRPVRIVERHDASCPGELRARSMPSWRKRSRVSGTPTSSSALMRPPTS